jgi:hypothetical protein
MKGVALFAARLGSEPAVATSGKYGSEPAIAKLLLGTVDGSTGNEIIGGAGVGFIGLVPAFLAGAAGRPWPFADLIGLGSGSGTTRDFNTRVLRAAALFSTGDEIIGGAGVRRPAGLVPSPKGVGVGRAEGLVPSPGSVGVGRVEGLVPSPGSVGVGWAAGLGSSPTIGGIASATTADEMRQSERASNRVCGRMRVISSVDTGFCPWIAQDVAPEPRDDVFKLSCSVHIVSKKTG